MNLSDDQAKAFGAILDWRESSNKDGLLTLGGFAGTGKTTVLGHLAAKLVADDALVAYATFTGRASSILGRKLTAQGVVTTNKSHMSAGKRGFSRKYHEDFGGRSKGPPFCGTLHRLLYRAIINPVTEELIGFTDRNELDRDYDLLIVDEASMVGGEMLSMLRRFGVPILAVGDHGQLPPVGDDGVLMKNPTLRLEKIHRQAEGNPIIRLAHDVREGNRLGSGHRLVSGAGVEFRPKNVIGKVLTDAYQSRSAVDALNVGMLCWMNRTRIWLNHSARLARGLAGKPPAKGEHMIALRNDPPVYNGMRGVLEADSIRDDKQPWILHTQMEFPDEGVPMDDYAICDAQLGRDRPFASLEEINDRGIDVASMKSAGKLYDFGYALTVHKCVAPETLVETPNGLIAAGNLPREGFIATPKGRARYHGFVRNPPSSMISITTKDGYSLKVTPNHGVDVYDPDLKKYVRWEASSIRPGAIVRLRLGGEYPGLVHVPLPGEPQKLDVRAKLFTTPPTLDAQIAEFFGLMVADGTIYKRGFRLAKRHKDVADRFDSLCRYVFGVEPKRFFKLGAYHVEVNSTYCADWMRLVGGMSPKAKDVPSCVMQASLVQQAAFLRGLFEDGTVNLRKKSKVLDHIEWTSVSPSLRHKVRTMLLRFGVICGHTPNRPEAIYIYGQQAKTFARDIGFVSAKKNERLNASCTEVTRYRVPALGKFPACYRHEVTGPKSDMNSALGFHHSEVSEIKYYIGPSVCVTVPDGHQFLQNGFAGWNSQGSQFQHVIVYLDRPEKPYDDDWRRWMYTAVTRASERLTVLT